MNKKIVKEVFIMILLILVILFAIFEKNLINK